MANIGEYGRIPAIQLYNIIPTAGVAGTAYVVLVNAVGQKIATVTAMTVSVAASNLYTVLLAAVGQAIMDAATGGTITPSVEVKYDTGGTAGTASLTTAEKSFWSAATEYYFGVIENR